VCILQTDPSFPVLTSDQAIDIAVDRFESNFSAINLSFPFFFVRSADRTKNAPVIGQEEIVSGSSDYSPSWMAIK
jgi:hypothetical protein